MDWSLDKGTSLNSCFTLMYLFLCFVISHKVLAVNHFLGLEEVICMDGLESCVGDASFLELGMGEKIVQWEECFPGILRATTAAPLEASSIFSVANSPSELNAHNANWQPLTLSFCINHQSFP